MVRATEITFYQENPHGVFESHNPTTRTVLAEIRSVGMKEFYLAHNDGIEPELVFRLTDYADYEGEKLVEFNGVMYDVIRAYVPVEGQTIDITVKRREKNQ